MEGVQCNLIYSYFNTFVFSSNNFTFCWINVSSLTFTTVSMSLATNIFSSTAISKPCSWIGTHRPFFLYFSTHQCLQIQDSIFLAFSSTDKQRKFFFQNSFIATFLVQVNPNTKLKAPTFWSVNGCCDYELQLYQPISSNQRFHWIGHRTLTSMAFRPPHLTRTDKFPVISVNLWFEVSKIISFRQRNYI